MSNMSDAREWLSVEDACALLGISRNTLKKLIREGRVPAYTIEGVVGYKLKRSEVDTLIKPVPVQPTNKKFSRKTASRRRK